MPGRAANSAEFATSLYLETTNIDHGTNDTGYFNYDDRGGLIYSESDIYNQILGYEQVPVYELQYVMYFDENGDPYFVEEWVFSHYENGDIIWQYPNGTPWLGTSYTYDMAGYVQKSVEEIEEDTKYKTTWNYYNRAAWASSNFRKNYDQPAWSNSQRR